MPARSSIAIVSLACRLPDARSPAELWANVIEGRRSFRPIPRERLDLASYAADSIGEADSITPICAGLLTNWSFDRGRFRIGKSTFDATDLTHWLALELAAEAIEAIGGTERLDRTRTAVIVANTLTGEFSRASLLRLRAPFLDELVAEAAKRTGLPGDQSAVLRSHFLAELRGRFPEPTEDSLAGGLANTIAGRIANYFDLHGGAYTVDGACASSLVAVADAATLLASDEVDAVIVGAIDLSLDPFELVGFSRNGALAKDEMRVFDARSSGFWPGEGGAFAVLMRTDRAQRGGLPILACIRGWGLSTDGAGGLTRPSIAGQLLAAQRACAAAAIEPKDLAFVEAHGTGTAVGDPVEIRALATLRDGARRSLPVGSIKANIGHTKAAAGFAGLLKAVEALRHGIVPPHVGCSVPHSVFSEVEHCVHPACRPQPIDDEKPLAGVSSFGFGGVNTHVVLEGGPASGGRRLSLPPPPRFHEAELFLFAGEQQDVLQRIAQLDDRAGSMSVSELADAAAFCEANLGKGPIKAAVVASRQAELSERLVRANALITAGRSVISANEGVFVGEPTTPPRLGFVFPGQAAPSRPDGGIWQRCFKHSASLTRWRPGHVSDRIATDIAQPAIMAANLAALQLMRRFGVKAEIAVGHSLGEIAALCWAGALSEDAALRLARRRGRIMSRDGRPGGGMLRVAMSAADARLLAARAGVTVACENGSFDTVLAGSRGGINQAVALSADSNNEATQLAVSHAFHSEDMATAAPALREALGSIEWKPLRAAVVSTVTGRLVDHCADFREMLTRQLTERVLFDAAMHEASLRADLFVEVGPGEGLSRLVRKRGIPCLPLEAFGASLEPLLATLAELHVRGCDLDFAPLFAERRIRPLELSKPALLESPCAFRRVDAKPPVAVSPMNAPAAITPSTSASLAAVLTVLAAETGLPASSFGYDDRFLDKLHLNSLAVSRIVLAAARSLACRPPSMPTEFANATPRILADSLKELCEFEDGKAPGSERINGVRRWVRTYRMIWTAVPARPRAAEPICWTVAGENAEGLVLNSISGEPGLLIWIKGFDVTEAERLVDLAVSAARAGTPHLAICHDRAPVSGFARSVARERHFRSVRVIDRAGAPSTDSRIASALGAALDGYYEVRFGAAGAYEEPTFTPAEPELSELAAVGPGDVAVVIGGAKGITAECALRIGNRGAALILVGRSPPEDEAVLETLRRARVAGLRCCYVQADVLDRKALSASLIPAFAELGPATVLVHAPAVNEPAALTSISNEGLRRTLAPKTIGLECAIGALGSTLRRIVAFGSIIGRIGLEGEAHYALANAMQTAATESWAREMPGRSALNLEWSVWSGTGMGERMGTLDRLAAVGVDALSLDDALGAFDTLIGRSATGTIAVTSRFGPPPELGLGASDLPSLRFIDEPKIHFPGVEIVVQTTLSLGRDPYLQDHIVEGRVLLPGVLALEAMAQAAEVLAPFGPAIAITGVHFLRAVAFDRCGEMCIRIAALRTTAGVVEAILVAEDDGYREPCACATFSPGIELPAPLRVSASSRGFDAAPLYGGLLFQSGRFRRVDRFETATSREVAARLTSAPTANWFGAFEPRQMVLWDPGASDAAMHALQAAVPHRRVLPVGVERIELVQGAGDPVHIAAIERSAAEGTYVFDVTVEDACGRVVQAWTGATFRAFDRIDAAASVVHTPALIVPYLERLAREGLQDDTVRAAFIIDPDATRTGRRSVAIGLLGIGDLDRRGDGRPIRTRSTGSVSIAHADGITLMVAAKGQIGCDLERIPRGAAGLLELREHVATESFRKLGRVTRPSSMPALNGEAVLVDEARLLVVELPTPFGPHLVGLGGAPARAEREI
ncbi:SDR family NAD(P)-dependent oxidoreductase [Sinorhizobium medicae]|nr:SDR family NAD(P)-dependent oxidoreductase [Sinorhizobium medicae]